MAPKNGTAAMEKSLIEAVAEAASHTPDLHVPKEVVAELVALGLQTELGDSYWRGFCAGRGYPEPMRLGIDAAEAIAGPLPLKKDGAG